MRARPNFALTLAAILTWAVSATTPALADSLSFGALTLRGPSDFEAVEGPEERSRALFREASKVLLHPRCLNCHPSDDMPRQGDEGRVHVPPVTGGADGHGVAVLQCGSCHQPHNVEHARLPGAPHWHLAPSSMAWRGKTLAEICFQLKDPAANGGRDLVGILDHVRRDSLVGWSWLPGPGREPAPGSQETFAALMTAWVETGAVCPLPGAGLDTAETAEEAGTADTDRPTEESR